MAKLKLGVIVGSNRRDSINRKLARGAGQARRRRLDANFIQIDDLPMYNQDNEQPLPSAVARFKSEVEGSDALLFVTPEHSRSIPAVLKNAIDWGARPWGKTSWPGKPGGGDRHVRRRHLDRGGAAAPQGRARHAGPACDRRRGLYPVQAGDDRRRGERAGRDRARLPEGLRRSLRRLRRPARARAQAGGGTGAS